MQKKNIELKKHVATIHCSNKLGLLQRKLSNALLFYAYPYLLQREEHEITMKEICSIINYAGNNISFIKDTLKNLMTTVIEWNLVDDTTGEEDWTASTMLASVRIRGSVCTYSYSTRMRKLLYSPSMYGKVNLIIQAKFKSSYALALYENCVRYKGLPATKWFDLQSFRKIMGVPKDVYLIFRDFKKRVIEKAVEEVNAFSGFNVEPEFNKVNRQVVSVRFKLKNCNESSNTIEEKNNRLKENYSQEMEILIQKFAFSRHQAIELIGRYGIEKVKEKIEMILSSQVFKNGKLKNLAGYFTDAVRKDYQPEKSSRDFSERAQRENEINEKLKQEQLDQYIRYLDQEILNRYQQFSEKEKAEIETEFMRYIKGSLYYNLFLEQGISNPLVSHMFCEFFRALKKNLLDNFVGFNDFCKAQS
ncbi:MAG: replication initiation protein [Proteobacteria bacterium]|nr:replication initiation protein [Pseudomonadota bacterium]